MSFNSGPQGHTRGEDGAERDGSVLGPHFPTLVLRAIFHHCLFLLTALGIHE